MQPYFLMLLFIIGFGIYRLSSERLVLPYEHDVRFNGHTFNEPYYLSLVCIPLVGLEIAVFSLYSLYLKAQETLGNKMRYPAIKAYFREMRHALSLVKDELKGGNR